MPIGDDLVIWNAHSDGYFLRAEIGAYVESIVISQREGNWVTVEIRV